MRRQRNLLTVLGCSSSAALVLAMGGPVMATPTPIQELEPSLPSVSSSESNPIVDALGCSCATCQIRQLQSDY